MTARAAVRCLRVFCSPRSGLAPATRNNGAAVHIAAEVEATPLRALRRCAQVGTVIDLSALKARPGFHRSASARPGAQEARELVRWGDLKSRPRRRKPKRRREKGVVFLPALIPAACSSRLATTVAMVLRNAPAQQGHPGSLRLVQAGKKCGPSVPLRVFMARRIHRSSALAGPRCRLPDGIPQLQSLSIGVT